jgi:hypothetical protein
MQRLRDFPATGLVLLQRVGMPTKALPKAVVFGTTEWMDPRRLMD